jgi:hypothetical protein
MSPRNVLDERLEQLGSALRERPSVTDRVMHQLHQSLADGSLVKPTEFVGAAKVRRRWPFVITTVAAVAALAALALFMVPARSVGWEEINRAIKSQKWIRASVSYAEGGRGTIWLSPQHGIWAYKNDDRIEFDDGLHKVAYDYKTGAKQITKRRLSDEDQQRVFPVDFGSKDVLLSGWLFGEKVVEQHRQEVTEGGHKWIEFQLVFWRPVGNGGTLRVDPKTNLPASLVVATPDGKTSVKWTFDYPSSGPGDVYALGAPATATIEDRTPSNEGARALDGMAASRARIGDFRLDAATFSHSAQLRMIPATNLYRVCRRGSRWRIDLYLPHQIDVPLAEPTTGESFGEWFEKQLATCDRIPRFICDGGTVYEQTPSWTGGKPTPSGWHVSRHVAPGDLLAATGASGFPRDLDLLGKVYPDRFGTPGFQYEFDPHPSGAPGCVLWKLSARLATADPLVGHEWYYLSPEKGDAVVRVESFSNPPDAPPDPESTPFRSTRVMDDFRQSSSGFWYPTRIRETDSNADPNARRKPAEKPVTTSRVIRYHIDFNAALPDSLFEIDDARNPKTEPNE